VIHGLLNSIIYTVTFIDLQDYFTYFQPFLMQRCVQLCTLLLIIIPAVGWQFYTLSLWVSSNLKLT